MLLQGRQRWAGIGLIIFFVLLAVLTLFSNTIQTALLPKVTTEKPSGQLLVHRIEGNGIIFPKKEKVLNSDNGWVVSEVHVKENDRVEKGQVLVSFDSSESQEEMLEAEDQLKRHNLNREKLKEQYIFAGNTGDEEAMQNVKRDLELNDLDRNSAQRNIDRLKRELMKSREVRAPFNGIIKDIQAESGMTIPQGQKLMNIVQLSEGYEFSFTVEKDAAALLQEGEKVSVQLHGKENKKITGTLSDIKAEETNDQQEGGQKPPDSTDKRKIVIAISPDGVEGGEEASAVIEKEPAEQGLVIRSELLKLDGSKTYVWVVRENRNALGTTYTVQKAFVDKGDEVDKQTIILNGLSLKDDLITDSSEPLQEGNRIRLK